MGLRMQPRNEKLFTLSSKAGPNAAESAAILMERPRPRFLSPRAAGGVALVGLNRCERATFRLGLPARVCGRGR